MIENSKRITFVLPGIISVPMGGVRVVNRLAHLLSQKDYSVTLVYPARLEAGLAQYFRHRIKQYLDQKNQVGQGLYYQPGSRVDAIIVSEISEKYIPDGDFIIAVGWQTAAAVHFLSGRKGRKFYFLQSFEAYFTGARKVLDTYQLPLTKIAISDWIIREMVKLGQKALGPVGNSINPEEFYVDPAIEKTNDLLMLYHPAKIKNAKFGLEVLSSLKKKSPQLTAMIFSARQPLHKIPDWIRVIVRPDTEKLRTLYNMSRVFFSTSKWEGWGLTPMEAMACGCAVVAVKNQGIDEFLKNNINAFVIDEKDRLGAMDKISKLLEDTYLRDKFFQESKHTLATFSEMEFATRFEKCLNQKG
ncbi:MAG: glycosyltransferase family 4 protein [Candidatus Marinimicrobia bacterium]|nr:glycosyltransferase family 4 protein [Candidatus Neomarinimicrobiota bacterium]